jgi:type I restriction enzyme, S subunit
MSNLLSKGWVETSLKDVVIYKKGTKPKNTNPEKKEGYIPYLLIDEMEGKPIRNYTDDKIPTAQKNDVLIVWDGSIGKTATGLYGAIGSTIAALTPVIIPANFLEYFLKTAKPFIEQTSRGTGLQHINPKTFWPLSFPIPSLNEQKRIVAKLDSIMPRIEAVKKRLEKMPGIIKRFRQSVLTAAVTGKLTKKWREEHPEVESAEVLLEMIQQERKNEKLKTKNKYNFKITNDIDNRYVDFELPVKWVKNNLDTISLYIVDCPHSTPKWTESGKLCLRTTNFIPNKLVLDEVRFVSQSTYEKRIEKLKPKKGDVLYSREGGILGIACQLDIEEDLCLGQRMMMFRTGKLLNSKYLTFFLNSPLVLIHVENLIGGSAAPHINIRDIKQYPFPLPPLEEQKEIVRQVDKLFALSDKVEDHYKKAKVKIDNLSQSLLAKAFRGELVPQDPNDEPAEKLLERIMEEKAKMESTLKTVKKNSSTKEG